MVVLISQFYQVLLINFFKLPQLTLAFFEFRV
jgi:hypothetical protein